MQFYNIPFFKALFLLFFLSSCSYHVALPENISAYTPALKLQVAEPLPVLSCRLIHSVHLEQLKVRSGDNNTSSVGVLRLENIKLDSGFRPAWDLSATLLQPDGKTVKITEHAEFNWHWKRDVMCHHAALHFPVALAALEIKAMQQLLH